MHGYVIFLVDNNGNNNSNNNSNNCGIMGDLWWNYDTNILNDN